MMNIFTNLEVWVRETLRRDDEGAGIVEYLLLVVFIALAMIVALGLFTGQLSTAFSQTGNSLT